MPLLYEIRLSKRYETSMRAGASGVSRPGGAAVWKGEALFSAFCLMPDLLLDPMPKPGRIPYENGGWGSKPGSLSGTEARESTAETFDEPAYGPQYHHLQPSILVERFRRASTGRNLYDRNG